MTSSTIAQDLSSIFFSSDDNSNLHFFLTQRSFYFKKVNEFSLNNFAIKIKPNIFFPFENFQSYHVIPVEVDFGSQLILNMNWGSFSTVSGHVISFIANRSSN